MISLVPNLLLRELKSKKTFNILILSEYLTLLGSGDSVRTNKYQGEVSVYYKNEAQLLYGLISRYRFNWRRG